MPEVHAVLGSVSLAVGGVALVVAIGDLIRRRGPSRILLGLLLGVSALVGVNGLLGLALAVSRGAPRDPLHVLYGLAALAAGPLAIGLAAGRPARQQRRILAVAVLVLIGLVVRLLQTGT